MLVSLAIIAILAALLLPVLSRAKASGKRTACLNNLKQIAAGVHLYAGDSNEILFPVTNTSYFAFSEWTAYDPLMRSYAGLSGSPSPRDKLFACPADTFYYAGNGVAVLIPQSRHLQSNTCYSSYAFNAGNAAFHFTNAPYPGMLPGIMGSKLGIIKNPARTVLVTEFPALDGYSWHKPVFSGKHDYINNAQDVLSFADGHVSYTKMYCGSNNPSHTFKLPLSFDPPGEYDYEWSGN